MTIKIDNEQRARDNFARLFAQTPKQTTTPTQQTPSTQRRVFKVSK